MLQAEVKNDYQCKDKNSYKFYNEFKADPLLINCEYKNSNFFY